MEYDDRIKLRKYEGATTNINDFRLPPASCLRTREIYKWPSERVEKATRNLRQGPKFTYQKECHESYTKLRDNVYIPFDMLWSEMPIIRKKPQDRTIMAKPVDHGKAESISKRPRLYVSPAVSIDDVPDKEMRDMLLNYMYTTDWKNAEKATADYVRDTRLKKKGPACCCKTNQEKLKGQYGFMVSDIPRPVLPRLKPEIFPRISSTLRKYFDEWDKQQNRASVHPTTMFWKNTDRPRNIMATDGLVPGEVKEEIAKLIETDELRRAHDKLVQGYNGYRPTCATGVPLKTTQLPMCHPLLTTSQAITSRYAEDMRK